MTSIADAECHIETIRTDYERAGERVRRTLAGSLVTVERAFSHSGHHLYEFLQNADDAGSTRMAVHLRGRNLEILNDGCPFSYDDVEAVCDVGHSRKSPEGYIGYLGVGFKSVFLASEEPEIHSGPYHFAFRRNAWPEDFPWQVSPVPATQEMLPPQWRTRFILPLKSTQIVETLRREMEPDSLNPRVLLFLSNLAHLELVDEDRAYQRTVIREPVGDAVMKNGIDEAVYELVESNSSATMREQWLVMGRRRDVPDNVHADPTTQAWNRSDVRSRQVLVAFKLNDNGELESVTGTAHMGVFSFLPLREERIGLGFVVQGDFLTSPGRVSIMRDARWNQWIAHEILQLIKEQARELLGHPQRRRNALVVLWPEPPYGDSFFDLHLKKGLAEFLQRDVLLPAYDGTWVKPSEALYVPDPDSEAISVRGFISDQELHRLYGKKPLMPDVLVPHSMRWGAISEAFSLTGKQEGLLNFAKGEQLLKEKAAQGEIEFFRHLLERLYGWSREHWQPRTWRTYLGNAPIFLTERMEVRPYSQVWLRPPGLPSVVEDAFEFIHPELLTGTGGQFLRFIDVAEPNEGEIRRKLAEVVVPKMREQWQTAADSGKQRDLLGRFKEIWERDEVNANDLKEFLTVPTKTHGDWLPASALLFPSEFSPDPDIESLVRKGLLKGVPGEQPFEFVDHTLAGQPEEMEAWRSFLSALGVGERIRASASNWSERIALNVALLYESSRGRDVKSQGFGPVSEPERGQGYDIRSGESDGSSRFIEVKGTATGEGPITVRATTLRQALFGEHRDHFYVYVVTDVFSTPRLHVAHATDLNPDKLLRIGDIRLSLKDLTIIDTVCAEQLPSNS